MCLSTFGVPLLLLRWTQSVRFLKDRALNWLSIVAAVLVLVPLAYTGFAGSLPLPGIIGIVTIMNTLGSRNRRINHLIRRMNYAVVPLLFVGFISVLLLPQATIDNAANYYVIVFNACMVIGVVFLAVFDNAVDDPGLSNVLHVAVLSGGAFTAFMVGEYLYFNRSTWTCTSLTIAPVALGIAWMNRGIADDPRASNKKGHDGSATTPDHQQR